jgi:hypothetical protein
MYGDKIDSSSIMAKKKQYIGLGRFSPWILEPIQRSNVGQNINIINGVPLPAKNKNGVDNTIKHDANKDTLLLNQRLSSSINRKPKSKPIIILGSFIT